jgi:hypothetical protein
VRGGLSPDVGVGWVGLSSPSDTRGRVDGGGVVGMRGVTPNCELRS